MKEFSLGEFGVICELTEGEIKSLGDETLTLSYYLKTRKGWEQKIVYVTTSTLQAELDKLAKRVQMITMPCLVRGKLGEPDA